jgi:anti-anti-sigma factor
MSEINSTVLKLSNDIYGNASFALKDQLNQLLEDGVFQITLDLSNVEIIDSVGLGVLLKTHQKLSKVSGSLSLQKVNQSITDLLEMTHLDQYLRVD